jgi:hypothetical protein
LWQRSKNCVPELWWRLDILERIERRAQTPQILAQGPALGIGEQGARELSALLPVELAIDLGVN